jgi:hypothetical protein
MNMAQRRIVFAVCVAMAVVLFLAAGPPSETKILQLGEHPLYYPASNRWNPLRETLPPQQRNNALLGLVLPLALVGAGAWALIGEKK